jgi:hypothetical protein
MPFITQILLPMRGNVGRPFGRELYDAFHARLIHRFGGWTRKGQAEGAWLSGSGEIFRDEHWVYEVGHARRDLRFWQTEKGTTQEGVRAGRDLDHAIRRTPYLIRSQPGDLPWAARHPLL